MSSLPKPLPPAVKIIFARAFPLLFIGAGAVVLFIGARDLVNAKASSDWPSVEGVVVETAVERHRSRENKPRTSGSKKQETDTYHAKIQYEFSVDGNSYRGSRIAYGDYGSSDPSHAEAVVNRYPVGMTVAVHVMPGNPEKCLLEPGLGPKTFALPGFGVVFLVVGCLMAVVLPKAIRKSEGRTP